MLPPVTAVIPTHNRPALMQIALQSVLDQDYTGDVEVIVVFDACEPFEPEVPIPEGRTLRLVANERSRGLAGARNTGIQQATHDFVAFLDDDDSWLPEKLRSQMELFQAEPFAALVGTAMQVDTGHDSHERLIASVPVTRDQLFIKRPAALHSSSFVFRKDALIDIGMVDENVPGSYGEDIDLLLRVSKLGPIPVVNSPLTRVTWQGQSFFFGKWSQYGDALQWLIQRHPEFEKYPVGLAHVESQIAFARSASGQHREGRRWAKRALKRDRRQPKAILAWGIGAGLLPASWVIRVVQRMGKGI